MVPVSVVIPVYNGERWIGAAIESVRAQDYSPDLLEIIVVDDGSTDASAAAAGATLAKSGISFEVIRTQNGGPSRARNIGWRRARAEWIQFLDADDVIAPHKIRLQALAASTAPGNVEVLYSDWQTCALDQGQWTPVGERKMPSLDPDVIAALIDASQFVHTGAAIFRRTSLQRVEGFDERHWLIEDVDLLLRMAMSGGRFRRVASAEPLFSYRHYDSASLSRRNPAAFLEGCVRNAALVEEYWRASNELSAPRASRIAGIYHQAARFFAAANRKRFEELVQQIETLVPGFVPESPALLRRVSRVVGFRRAELLSVRYRRVKSLGTSRKRA